MLFPQIFVNEEEFDFLSCIDYDVFLMQIIARFAQNQISDATGNENLESEANSLFSNTNDYTYGINGSRH